MEELLEKIPQGSRIYVKNLLSESKDLEFRISRNRKTKHGDFRLREGKYSISINEGLGPYRFLITLIHEIAHFQVAKDFKNKTKPHGLEWKVRFQRLMLPILNPEIFPKELLPVLAQHFKNPKASTDRDYNLSIALDRFEKQGDITYLYELENNREFTFKGKSYIKLEQRRKRILALRKEDQKKYSFSPSVPINL